MVPLSDEVAAGVEDLGPPGLLAEEEEADVVVMDKNNLNML